MVHFVSLEYQWVDMYEYIFVNNVLSKNYFFLFALKMASLVGASYNKPLSIVPCLSWTTASCAFTQGLTKLHLMIFFIHSITIVGVLSEAIPWNLLESQYLSYGEDCRREMTKMLHSPEDVCLIFLSPNCDNSLLLYFQLTERMF